MKKTVTKLGRGTYVNKKRTGIVKITKYNEKEIHITFQHKPFETRTMPQIMNEVKRRWTKL